MNSEHTDIVKELNEIHEHLEQTQSHISDIHHNSYWMLVIFIIYLLIKN